MNPELDLHLWKVKEVYKNVSIEVMENECGDVEISWYRQTDTEEVDDISEVDNLVVYGG